jgi:hypothetical protein
MQNLSRDVVLVEIKKRLKWIYGDEDMVIFLFGSVIRDDPYMFLLALDCFIKNSTCLDEDFSKIDRFFVTFYEQLEHIN